MTTYIVTMELKTSKWKRFLRFFRIIKPREDFELIFYHDCFEPNEIIENAYHQCKIIKKK